MDEEKKYCAVEFPSYMEDFIRKEYPFLEIDEAEDTIDYIVVRLDKYYTAKEVNIFADRLEVEYARWDGKPVQPKFTIGTTDIEVDDMPEPFTIDELEQLIAEIPSEPSEPKPFKNPPKKRKRSVQVMTRLTPEEDVIFKERVVKSGQTQADFIRSAILTGEIKELPKMDDQQMLQLNENLLSIKSNLGKIGGLLKSMIKPQAENELINEQDWYGIKKMIKQLQAEQKRIEKEVSKLWQ